MNIGILSAGLPPERIGGAEVQAMRLAEHLGKRHDVEIFTRSRVDSDSHRGPYSVVCRSRVRTAGIRFGADLVSTLAALVPRRHSLDVLIAYQTVIDGLIGTLAKLLLGVPLIVSIRSEQEYAFDRRWQSRWFGPFVMRHADRLATQSPAVERGLLDALERSGRKQLRDDVVGKLFILPNGISIPEVPPTPREHRHFLFVGRLVPAKGVHVLIDAMRACPDRELVIVGDGPERTSLESRASGLSNVSFVGRVLPDDIEPHYASACALILPSLRDEGFPNVLMEAMARGVPVIASRDAGTPDLVVDGKTGFLTEPGDSAAIARSIERLATDDSLRERMSARCRESIRPYHWPAVIETLEPVLSRIGTRFEARSRGDGGGRTA